MDDQIALRPVVDEDLALLEELSGGDPVKAGAFGWYGWRDRDRWRRHWAENGLLGDDGGSLMVVRDRELLGCMNWRIKRSTPTAYHWEIGIALLPPHVAQGRQRMSGCVARLGGFSQRQALLQHRDRTLV